MPRTFPFQRFDSMRPPPDLIESVYIEDHRLVRPPRRLPGHLPIPRPHRLAAGGQAVRDPPRDPVRRLVPDDHGPTRHRRPRSHPDVPCGQPERGIMVDPRVVGPDLVRRPQCQREDGPVRGMDRGAEPECRRPCRPGMQSGIQAFGLLSKRRRGRENASSAGIAQGRKGQQDAAAHWSCE